jgi:hypothetical protein
MYPRRTHHTGRTSLAYQNFCSWDLLLGQRNGPTRRATRFAVVQHALHIYLLMHDLASTVLFSGTAYVGRCPAERGKPQEEAVQV